MISTKSDMEHNLKKHAAEGAAAGLVSLILSRDLGVGGAGLFTGFVFGVVFHTFSGKHIYDILAPEFLPSLE